MFEYQKSKDHFFDNPLKVNQSQIASMLNNLYWAEDFNLSKLMCTGQNSRMRNERLTSFTDIFRALPSLSRARTKHSYVITYQIKTSAICSWYFPFMFIVNRAAFRLLQSQGVHCTTASHRTLICSFSQTLCRRIYCKNL